MFVLRSGPRDAAAVLVEEVAHDLRAQHVVELVHPRLVVRAAGAHLRTEPALQNFFTEEQ